MKRLLATLIFASLAAALSAHSSQAEEQEIRSTGGAYQGKFRFKEIDPTDALLVFELAGRRIIGVRAGYIGNRSYREVWEFENSFLEYDRLPRRMAFKTSSFNERNTPIRFCGKRVKQNCDVLEVEKLSKNLIVMTYRDRGTDEACGGLNYIDEDVTSRGPGMYGNYNVVISTCISETDAHEDALALSAYYLSLIKKDGRTIARLSRYDLPKPTNALVCDWAIQIYADEWEKNPEFSLWVDEARNRGLQLNDCVKLLKANEPIRDSAFGRAPDYRVCNMATENGAWQQRQSLQNWVAEARDRGLTLEDCEKIIKAK